MGDDTEEREPLTTEMRRDIWDATVMEANALEAGIFYLSILFSAFCIYTENVFGLIFFSISMILIHVIRKINVESCAYTLQEKRKESKRLDRINASIDWISIASFSVGMLFIILNLGVTK